MAGSAHHMGGLVAPKLSGGYIPGIGYSSVFFFETETHSIFTLLLCIL